MWCNNCGRYTSRIPQLLREACPRKPMSEAGRNVLHRLRRGLPPTTAKYLAAVEEEAGAEVAICVANDHVQGGGGGDHQHHQHHHVHEVADGVAVPGERLSRDRGSNDERAPADTGVDGDAGHSEVQGDGRVDRARVSLTSIDVDCGLRPRPRRRLTGKQRVHGGAGGVTTSLDQSDCRRQIAGAGWSRRIGIVKLVCPSNCSNCGIGTKTTCSVCKGPLCTQCARARRPCNGATSAEAHVQLAVN
jgi:hypothetical protein